MASSERGAGDGAPLALRLAPGDNVAVAARPLWRGQTVEVEGFPVTLAADIATGHKLALRAIGEGETVVKYACPIGVATRAIAAGEHVHVHNVKSGYLPTYTLPE